MATLYRCTTPTNWLCPCGKVARALEREGVSFEQVGVPQRRSRRPEVEALSGHLCRCTGYVNIVRSIEAAAASGSVTR